MQCWQVRDCPASHASNVRARTDARARLHRLFGSDTNTSERRRGETMTKAVVVGGGLTRNRQGWQGRPTVIASNIIYSHRAEGLLDDEIVRATVAELAEFAPEAARATLLHARVHRVPMAIPCPLVGFEGRRPPQRCAVPGLVLAGDWTRTRMPCTMEGAVKSGALAAEAVLERAGQPAALAIEARMYDDVAGMVRKAAARRPKGVP